MPQTNRHDIYAFIHKGLRKAMCDSLQRLGCCDPHDDQEFDEVAGAIQQLLRVCLGHVEHENHFVHTAMEARCPGSSSDIAGQHVHHEEQILSLSEELERLRKLPALRRADQLHRYYRQFAHWVGDNLIHMEQEETEHNATLWAWYTDDEIRAIEQELVAHIEPALFPVTQGYILAGMNPPERAGFLGMVREHMPAEEFDDLLGMLPSLLSPAHYKRLLGDLRVDALASVS